MTLTGMEKLQPEDGWASQDEGAGNGYLAVLMRWSREIVVITLAAAVLAGLAAFAVNRLTEPRYKASADIAIVRTVSQLNFDQRFTTTSDEALRSDGDLVMARRNALIGLAESPAIAVRIIEPLGDVLNAKERVPTNLVRQVKATMVNPTGRPSDSDLIRITATADTPDKAARIATAWAETYVRQVNLIYGQAPDELLASVSAQQAQAKTSYEKAQVDLERFTAENRLDVLNRQITETQGVIDEIVQARVDLSAAYFSAEAQSRTARFEDWLQVTRALDQTRTLRTQVAQGGAGATGSSAVVAGLLKLQALTQVLAQPRSAGQPQVQLQIQPDANSKLTSAELLADIDALVQALEQRRSELERQIAAPDEQWLNADRYAHLAQSTRGDPSSAGSAQAPQASLRGQDSAQSNAVSASAVATTTVGSELLDSLVRGLEQEVRGLRAQRETEQARQLQLSQQRDLAWETLKTLDSKVSELAVSRAAAGSEVRFAAAAVPPARPDNPFSTVKAIALGGIVGLLIGVCTALVASSLGVSPFFSRRQANA
jgi:capsular polysaccharide biosynthesis protein